MTTSILTPPRTTQTAGESQADGSAHLAQQPITAGSRVMARERHYRHFEQAGKRRKHTDTTAYRLFEGVGIVRTLVNGLATVQVDGRLQVARVEQLEPAPPEPRKSLDDLLYDQPALPPGAGSLVYHAPVRGYLPERCLTGKAKENAL